MEDRETDSEEAQKAKLVNEIIKVKFGDNMSPPTENMTTLEREDHERLSRAVCLPRQNNAIDEIVESLKARLEEKSLEELYKIRDEEARNKKARDKTEKLKAEVETKRRSFDMPEDQVDIDYWIKSAYWDLVEGVLIAMGKEPREVREKIKLYPDSKFVKTFQNNLELAKRAVHVGELQDRNHPSVFIAWADSKDLHVPDELRELVRPKLNTLKEVDSLDRLKTEPENSSNTKNNSETNELQSNIRNLINSIEHGNKPELIREIVLKIIDYAETQSNDFDRYKITGTYKDLMECFEKLTGESLNISHVTFKNYVKGKLGKYNDSAICGVTGKSQHPWGSIFPYLYN